MRRRSTSGARDPFCTPPRNPALPPAASAMVRTASIRFLSHAIAIPAHAIARAAHWRVRVYCDRALSLCSRARLQRNEHNDIDSRSERLLLFRHPPIADTAAPRTMAESFDPDAAALEGAGVFGLPEAP